MQGEKTTCRSCLNTEVLLLQTHDLDMLQLAACLKLARCIQAHKTRFNNYNLKHIYIHLNQINN
jgi:hypothetical protein